MWKVGRSDEKVGVSSPALVVLYWLYCRDGIGGKGSRSNVPMLQCPNAPKGPHTGCLWCIQACCRRQCETRCDELLFSSSFPVPSSGFYGGKARKGTADVVQRDTTDEMHNNRKRKAVQTKPKGDGGCPGCKRWQSRWTRAGHSRKDQRRTRGVWLLAAGDTAKTERRMTKETANREKLISGRLLRFQNKPKSLAPPNESRSPE